MEESRRKRTIYFIISLVVAVMFISSYAALGNNNLTTSTSTNQTNSSQKTYFVIGSANGVVTNYTSGATVYTLNASLANPANVSNTLSKLEANGSLSAVTPQNTGNFLVSTQKMNPYVLQEYLYNAYTPNGISVGNVSTYVYLPKVLQLYLPGSTPQKVNVVLTRQNFTVNIAPLQSIGTNVILNIHAAAWANGTVSQLQIINATPA